MRADLDFTKVVQQYAERIFNHSYRILGEKCDAEDATQEVLLRIHKSLRSFRGEAELGTWIWRITCTICLRMKASQCRRPVRLDGGVAGEYGIPAEGYTGPEEATVAWQIREQLTSSIARMPPREAAAITLFYLEEKRYKEIASIMGIPMGTVATLLRRGREKLRTGLKAMREDFR